MAEHPGAIWPVLSWIPDERGLDWLSERIVTLAHWAHGFDVAFEEATTGGWVDLGAAAEALAQWDGQVGHVWMLLDLAERKQIPLDEVAVWAQELGKVHDRLSEAREALVGSVRPGERRRFFEREHQAQTVPTSVLKAARPKLHESSDPGFGRLGEERFAQVSKVPAPLGSVPPTPEEVHLRMAAELEKLPDPPTLEALLQFLPKPQVHAIFLELGLGTGADGQPLKIRDYLPRVLETLTHPRALPALVQGLTDVDRALLRALLDGPLPYDEVIERFGSDVGDGFYWRRRPASGPLGQLRRVGLAYVGRVVRVLTVVVPADLVQRLRARV
jgi:hypothetical protein